MGGLKLSQEGQSWLSVEEILSGVIVPGSTTTGGAGTCMSMAVSCWSCFSLK